MMDYSREAQFPGVVSNSVCPTLLREPSEDQISSSATEHYDGSLVYQQIGALSQKLHTGNSDMGGVYPHPHLHHGRPRHGDTEHGGRLFEQILHEWEMNPTCLQHLFHSWGT